MTAQQWVDPDLPLSYAFGFQVTDAPPCRYTHTHGRTTHIHTNAYIHSYMHIYSYSCTYKFIYTCIWTNANTHTRTALMLTFLTLLTHYYYAPSYPITTMSHALCPYAPCQSSNKSFTVQSMSQLSYASTILPAGLVSAGNTLSCTLVVYDSYVARSLPLIITYYLTTYHYFLSLPLIITSYLSLQYRNIHTHAQRTRTPSNCSYPSQPSNPSQPCLTSPRT